MVKIGMDLLGAGATRVLEEARAERRAKAEAVYKMRVAEDEEKAKLDAVAKAKIKAEKGGAPDKPQVKVAVKCSGPKYYKKWARNNRDKTREAGKRWAEKNRGYFEERYDRRTALEVYEKHGVTFEQVRKADRECRHRCMVCGLGLGAGRVKHVDFMPEKGKIRGLTCGRCKDGFKAFSGNSALLRRAAEYLEGHG
ncbi:MAG: endonuclease domain-containing protein [Candidatus Omnitrophota bacterium]|jgi:hypothetical protein